MDEQNLDQLQQRLQSLETRLGGIEKRLGISSPASAAPARTAAPPATTPPSSTSSSAAFVTTAFTDTPVSTPSRAPVSTEPKASGNWLGIIAIVCFVLAAGFIIKLSVETGWLTPARQLGLATLFGFALIGAGFRLLKTDREYASLLPAGGVIVLYLTVFAAHRFYELVPFEVALIGITMVSALCVWLYSTIKHDLYALSAAIGSYLSPLILGMNSTNMFAVYYFALCSAAFATISVWVQSRTLAIVAAYLAIATTTIIGSDIQQNEVVAGLLAFHFTVFAIGTILHTRTTRVELSETAAFAYLPVLVLFYSAEYYFIGRINPQLAPWCAMGFAGVLIGLYVGVGKWFPGKSLSSRSVVLAMATLVLFHAGYLELSPDEFRPWLFPIILLALVFAPIGVAQSVTSRSRATLIPMLAIAAILGIEYVSMVFKLFERHDGVGFNSQMAVSLAALLSIWVCLAKESMAATRRFGHEQVLLSTAHILAILSFYQLVREHGSLAVSAAWLIYAIAVMAFAFKIRDELMAKSALLVLGLAAAKALLYDASSAPTIIRIVCLILTGAVLYGAGLLMRRISGWSKATP